MGTKTMTEKEAYMAMYIFLKNYYFSTKDEGVGNLASGLQLLPCGNALDHAYQIEFEKCCKEAKLMYSKDHHSNAL